jgi:hypothetical protein
VVELASEGKWRSEKKGKGIREGALITTGSYHIRHAKRDSCNADGVACLTNLISIDSRENE